MWQGIEKLATPEDEKKLDVRFLRALSLEETYKRVMRCSYHIGITRINDLTPLDIFPFLPVFSVVRPNVNAYQLTAAQGKGGTPLQSVVSALMEATERHAAETYQKFMPCSLDQLKTLHIPPKAFNIACADNTIIDWVRSLSLEEGMAYNIPASCVVFPYMPTSNAHEISNSGTTGIASGNTLLEATLHGMFEVIERDAVQHFLEGAPARYLDLESLPQELKNLIDQIEQTGSRICILDFSNFTMIPTVFVTILTKHPMAPSVMVAGQGCHVDLGVAIKRGIHEVIQSHTVSLQGSREDLIRHQSHWDGAYDEVAATWEEAKANAIKDGVVFFKETNSYQTTIKDTLIGLCNLIKKGGYEKIMMTDLTHPDVGIPVVSLNVPGMKDSTLQSQGE